MHGISEDNIMRKELDDKTKIKLLYRVTTTVIIMMSGALLYLVFSLSQMSDMARMCFES